MICHRVLPLFCQVVKIVPKDPDAIKKLRECEKAVQKLRFEEAIATSADNHSIVDSVDYESMCMYLCLILLLWVTLHCFN